MAENNRVKWVGVRPSAAGEAIPVTLYRNCYYKRYSASATIAASSSGTITLSPPSGYKWLWLKIYMAGATGVSGTFKIDDNVVYNIAEGADLNRYIAQELNVPLPVHDSITVELTNSDTVDHTMTVVVNVLEYPETAEVL
ncbi:MAG: hypothetical protein J7J61_03665 [Candidatus Hydrothermae bacterium]|nr:hypothetical protein [Candidatus Hydrothermae bacterium]